MPAWRPLPREERQRASGNCLDCRDGCAPRTRPCLRPQYHCRCCHRRCTDPPVSSAACRCDFSIFGTPAEELGIGKIELIKAGCFDGVDFAMMVHPSSRRQVIKHFLGLAKIRFTFHGKPSHAAAYPEDGINALDAVIQTFNRSMRYGSRHGRMSDPRHHYRGGTAPNIIPARASCYFYVRADDLQELERSKSGLSPAPQGLPLPPAAALKQKRSEGHCAAEDTPRLLPDLLRDNWRCSASKKSAAPAGQEQGVVRHRQPLAGGADHSSSCAHR